MLTRDASIVELARFASVSEDATEPHRIAGGEVHVWLADANGDPDSSTSALSGEERDRAAAMPRTAADTFVAARRALRSILGLYLGTTPEAVPLRLALGGKPELDCGERIMFNLAHSAGVALVAVTRDRAVGIDVERPRLVRGWERIARRLFGPDETAVLTALPVDDAARRFAVRWTETEALLKARGCGMGPGGVPGQMAADRPSFAVRRFALNGGLVGAVAVQGQATLFRWWRLEPSKPSVLAPSDRELEPTTVDEGAVFDDEVSGTGGEFVSLPEVYVVSPSWGRFRREDVAEGSTVETGTVLGLVTSNESGTFSPVCSSIHGVFLGWMASEGESIGPGSYLARIGRGGNGSSGL